MLSSYSKNKTQSRCLILAVGIIFGFSFSYIWMSTWNRIHSISNAVEPKIHYTVDESQAQHLYNQVRVLCWVITNEKNHKTKARAVQLTWGSRCNILLFISTKEDKKLPAVALNTNQLWSTTKDVLTYIHDNYIDSADWFLRADDENFIVVENVRHLVEPFNPDRPSYFGRKFIKHVEKGYMSSGASYVLSREAIKLFVEVALRDPEKCTQGIGLDDVELGNCLANVGVLAADSSDVFGQQRFFPFQPEVHMNMEYLEQIPWFFDYINASKAYVQEMDCCSQSTISFHDVAPDTMYVYNYLLYNLRSIV